MVITWLDRFGGIIGTVAALSTQYSAATDGTDELTLLTTDNITKGQRLMWRDENDRISGLVHELVVSSVKTIHDKRGRALNEVKAINSICELYWTDVPKQSGIYTPHYSSQLDSQGNQIQNGYTLRPTMLAVLNGTRWEWVDGGHFDIGGTIEYVGMKETYDVSVREIIAAAAAGYSGAEVRTYVFADYETCEVTHRYVSIAYPLPGSAVTDLQTRGRFEFNKNTTGVVRDIGDAECYTAVRVIGAEIKDSSGTVTGRHEVYLESQNAAHLQKWGKPMPDGTIGHSVYTVSTSEDSDQVLLEYAAETLEDLVTPDVTYTVNLADMEKIRLREYVDVVDEDFPGTLRMRARVTSLTQDLLDEHRAGVVTFGKTMNYAAVAASYQNANAVTASSKTDSAISNRVSATGRSGDSTTSRLSAAEREIEDLKNASGGGGGGGGLNWPLIANKSWWDNDDSFTFFNNGRQFGITGKGNDLGVYATADESGTPDPQTKTWGVGSEVWQAGYGTIHNAVQTAYLHVKNIVGGVFRFTDNGAAPSSSHIFAKLFNNAGVLSQNNMRGLGLFYTGHSSTSGGTTTDVPFLTIEPQNSSANAPGLRVKTQSLITQALGYIHGFPFLNLESSASSATAGYAYLKLQTPIFYTNGTTPYSRAQFELDGTQTSMTEGRGTAKLEVYGQDATNGTAKAGLYCSSYPSAPSSELQVNKSSGSSNNYAVGVDRTGVYAANNSTKTYLHQW